MLKTYTTGLLIAALSMAAAAALGEDAGTVTPTEVAEHFLKAFEQKDLDAVLSNFAPGALVQRVRLADGTEPELAHFEAPEWAASAGQGIAGIQNFRIEILESKAVSFDDGTTVSVRFRATGQVGQAGEVSFINNGVDSFSMILIDGQWRITLYNSIEKIDFPG